MGPGERPEHGHNVREFDLSNPVRSFAATVRLIFLEPRQFFAGMATGGSLKSPLVFALACLLASSLLEGLADRLRGGWTTSEAPLLGRAAEQGLVFGAALIVLGVLFFVTLTPLFALLSLYLFSGIVHLLVMLFMEEKLGFEATLRVVSYTSATQLLSWVPFVGFLANLYGLYVLVIGLRRVHGAASETTASAGARR